MSLFPLHKNKLCDDEGDYEDEHHFCVHGLVAFVFGMHSRMLHPVERKRNTLDKFYSEGWTCRQRLPEPQYPVNVE